MEWKVNMYKKTLGMTLGFLLLSSVAFAAMGQVSCDDSDLTSYTSSALRAVKVEGISDSTETRVSASKVDTISASGSLYRNDKRIKDSSDFAHNETNVSVTLTNTEYGTGEYTLYIIAQALYSDGSISQDKNWISLKVSNPY
jgi:hypothetical protein